MDKIRIFDEPWHVSHQFEMCKFPFAEFYWLCNHRRSYNQIPRGDMEGKKMFEWVAAYEEGKYDVAILHLDQQCIEDSILELGKGLLYTQLNEVIKDIPKIVIMHGTPYYPEKFPNSQDIINKVKELIGDNYLVVNSHRAAEQWKLPNIKTIIHGMDKDEWWDLQKEPRVITMISPAGLPAYYDRSFLDAVKDALEERNISHCHITVDYIPRNFDEYREFLGRSLIYFNPTKESPMPRARTEAMLSGCCVLTTPGQDADTFIKDGYNGFIIKRNPEFTADLCEKLIDNPQIAIEIGQRGKKTAQELFSMERYQKEWQEYLNFVIKDYKEKHK